MMANIEFGTGVLDWLHMHSVHGQMITHSKWRRHCIIFICFEGDYNACYMSARGWVDEAAVFQV